MNPIVEKVTNTIIERSHKLRQDYLTRMANAKDSGPARNRASCGNLAHGMAACNSDDKSDLTENISVVSFLIAWILLKNYKLKI